MSKTIFISYAREDFDTAQKLYQDLKKMGFEPWLDEYSLLPGSRWKPAIKTAIHNSLFFVALLSSQAVGKRGYVQREVKEALEILDEFPESEIFVIPVRLDNCKPTHEKLNELNWVNLFPSYESGFQKIVKVLNSKGLVAEKYVTEEARAIEIDGVIISSDFDSAIQKCEISQVIELIEQNPNFEHYIIQTISNTNAEKALRTKALQAFLEAGRRNEQLVQDLLNKTESDIRYFTLRKAIEFELAIDESTLRKLFADVSNDIVKNAIILTDMLVKQRKVSVEILGDLHIAKHSYWVIRSTAIATIIKANTQESVSILAKYTTTTYHVSRKLICNYFKHLHIENRLDEVDRGKAIELLKTYIADGQSSIAVQKIMQKTLQLIAPDLYAINYPSTINTLTLKNQVDEKITILFLGVNPVDTNRLRLDQEIREINDVLQRTKYRDRFGVEQSWALRIKDLQNALLRFQPHIVHFSGHGTINSELVFEDENGISKPVPPNALSNLFANLRDNIRLVILNACYSDAQAQAIAEHIDCVVAIADIIEDIAAVNFISSFYQALAYGKDVSTAFELGKNRLHLENHYNCNVLKLLVKPTLNPKDLSFI